MGNLYQLYIIKRKLENVLLFPLILLGRLLALLFPLKKYYTKFLFFPFYHTGGAEKVHAKIANIYGGEKTIIFFTKKNTDTNFFEAFRESGATINDISAYTDNKFIYFVNIIFRGIISGYINHQKPSFVFNGQCNFAYKISPWIRSTIPQLELIHSFNSFSWIRPAYLAFITKTIMIAEKRIDDHLQQYFSIGIPHSFKNNIVFIPNCTYVPNHIVKPFKEKLQVLFVGRNSPEKRIHLIAAIAKHCIKNSLPVSFNLVGIDNKNLETANLFVHGLVTKEQQLTDYYKASDIVLITSDTEGFPMAIMEGMAYSCVPISTPVGDVPYRITNGENGYIFSSITDEDKIVNEAVVFFTNLLSNTLRLQLQANAHSYANNNFSEAIFEKKYMQLAESIGK